MVSVYNRKQTLERLDYYYQVINTTVLSKQNPASGLIPASVAITTHGNYTDAWVRDNVYSIYCVYGLALAYRRVDDTSGRAFELEHAVIKLMRGLLFAMMRQAPKVEKFKKTQNIFDALHAKYDTKTGETVVGDRDWGHLQIDATSLFIVALADMTTSGLSIIFTQDEVDFVQNLVFYIELLSVIGFPAFAVDDPQLVEYTKHDAKKKLEGRYGWKRFLRDGHQTVVEDHTRLHYNESELKVFENIESEWPLFFTYMVLEGLFSDNFEQVEEYRKKLDFVTIDSCMWDPEHPMPPEDYNNSQQEKKKRPDMHRRSTSMFIPSDLHIPLLPELYYVPAESIEAEKKDPHSQKRIPNENTPLVWALSLYLLGNLMHEKLLSPSELDPLGRRFNMKGEKVDNVVQIVLLSESEELQRILSNYGLETQTVEQISSSFTVMPPQTLVDIYSALGQNQKLGLSGRPNRPIGTLATSRLYRIQGHIYAFTPQFMDVDSFYLNSDPDYLVSTFETELSFTNHHWTYAGRPTITVVLTSAMLGEPTTNDQAGPTTSNECLNAAIISADSAKKNLLNFFMNLRSGECNGIRVRLSRLAETLNTSNIESLDFLVNKPDIDWSTILLNNKKYHKHHYAQRRLNDSNAHSGTHTPGGARTPRRKSVFGGKLLGTPLDKLSDESYFQDVAAALEKINNGGISSFKLKDHEVAPNVRSASPIVQSDTSTPVLTSSPSLSSNQISEETGGDMLLSLTLGDPSQFDAAVQSLKESVNLYDQIDLLQYLASCKNLDHFIPDLDATMRNLLEEVYLKSRRLQYWSVARQASGLLAKTMPTLTNNLTDLVIRQKQVSIGSGSNEQLISTPLNPDALTKIINEQCSDDVREGPMVQEIIISLGNFIRTIPHMFDGILRLRTHYIIIALREEISRVNHLDEEEAIEHLMQLSPFELHSLLGSVLSSPGMCNDSAIMIRDRPGGLLILSKDFDPSRQLSIEVPSLTLPPPKNTEQDGTSILVRAQSGGYNAGNFARAEVNGNVLPANTRGLHIWAISKSHKLVLEHASFDTHISTEESDELAQFIRKLPSGLIVVMASKDDFTEHLTQRAIDAIKSLGSKLIDSIKYRDSYVLIAEKDSPEDAIEAHKPANGGPTELIERQFAIVDKDDITPSDITQDNVGHFFPTSNGRWLRRRKNDGALNRVPANFFPRTWSVLDQCHGFKIGNHCLPRDPTVFEKTPEEFNFALAVEGFLGFFKDPAERQLAIEVLTLIYDVQQTSGPRFIDCTIDIPAIADAAVVEFWTKWVSQNKETFEKSPFFKHGLEYPANKDLARHLFYDLPLDDAEESTSGYLSKSIQHILFNK
ncbi:hypothetical protein RMATCC62417_13649 [Rhizopus microsporus]|nr:hypothetical protein RMATCC62417_13649 [Rhizopus microsporus]